MKLTNVFCEKNIGMPVKWYQGVSYGTKLMWYGRYYGLGHDGESGINDRDADWGLMVTPDNRQIAVGLCCLDYELTDEDLTELEELEKAEERPYKYFFDIKDGKYIKNYGYRNFPLVLGKYDREWYEDHGLYSVETDVLGNAIAKIFSRIYGQEYYYQEAIAHCEDTNQYQWRREKGNRCMRIISPVKYKGKYYSSTTYHGVFTPPIYWDCMPTKDYASDNLFKHIPVEVNEGDFLLYFSDQWDPKKIRIGNMKNAAGKTWWCDWYSKEYQFTPNDFNGKCMDEGEVHFDNSRFISLSKFLKEVFDYKIKHYRLELTDEDMEIIIKKFLSEVEEEPENYIETKTTSVKNNKVKMLAKAIEQTTSEN